MNTPNNWKTTASITGSKRAQDWVEIFGGNVLPIKTIVPRYSTLPGFDRPQLVYDLDLGAITPQQRERLINFISLRFEQDKTIVATELGKVSGVPVLAEDVTVSSTDFGLFIDDWNVGLEDGEEYDLAIRYGWDDEMLGYDDREMGF